MKTGIEYCIETEAELANIERDLEEIRSLGYDCIDFQSFCHTENIFFKGSVRHMAGLADRVRKASENAGLVISQTHGPWRWPPHDSTDEERRERFEKMERSLEGTAMTGCADMVIHPIMPYGCDKDPEPERFMELNLDFFSRLTEKARAYGVVIDFENMPMPALSLATPAQIYEFALKIDSPYFKVCLDTGHCAVTKSDPAEAVRLIGRQYLRVLHVHDNDGIGDYHWLPGTGVINWSEFSKALHEINFDGTFSLETNVKAKDLTPEELLEKKKALALETRRMANG